MTAVALPPLHAPHTGGDPTTALRGLRGLVEHHITHQPRSLQKAIGPSELATPCDHCLGAKLAGWEQTPDGVPWLPFVGTCVHDGLERALITHENTRNGQHTTGLEWITERRVAVGQIGGADVTGSCDLFHVPTGTVIDWKIVGATTLRTAKRGPSPTYRGQTHLYGRGYTAAGFTVRHVAIVFLPRNSVSLDDAVWWTEPYDEQVALDVLARANRLQANLTALQQALGERARDGWITGLPRHPGCFDCARFPDAPAGITRPGHADPSAAFNDLLAG